MAAKKPQGYVALTSFAADYQGSPRVYTTGTYYPELTAKDVKGLEEFFAKPSTEDAPVETATAAPGEKRKTTRAPRK